MNIARNFGEDIALKKLNDLEKNIYLLEDNPYLGITPRYPVLKRQGYQVLIFYKINENKKQIIIYSVVDQRQDYLNIIQGL